VHIQLGEQSEILRETGVKQGSLIDSYLPRIEDKLLEAKKYVNLLRALEARRRRSLVVRHVPYEITLDAATVCQLSCPYCTTGNGTIKRTRAILQPEIHRSVIAELADRLFLVWYFSTGEPLLNKNIADIIGQTKGKEVFSIISTNLSMELSDERLQALVGSGLGLLTVSLDGATPNTYRKYRRGGDFDRVVRNLRRIVQIKQELGLRYPLVMWRFLVFEHNAHEARDVLRLAREWGVDLVEFFPGSTPEEIVDPDAVRPFKGELLVSDFSSPFLKGAWQRRDTPIRRLGMPPAEPGGPTVPGTRSKCDWLYFGSMLFPTGAIGPCCVSNDEPDDFGHLAEGNLIHIYNNERYRMARRVMRGENIDSDVVCLRCPNAAAQHFQFRLTLRSILLNAPAWALKMIVSDLEQYVDPIDRLVLPNVIGLIEGEELVRSVGTFTAAELREIYGTFDSLPMDDDHALLDFVQGISPASMC
jgi:MoaA/NifB/PqqE/SkfB family radical SAM enzyme